MSPRLRDEIRMTRAFESAELEAFLNLVRTADLLQREVAAVLKERDLTMAQYNILRILRGAGPDGLPCGEIAARLVSYDPDLTRLLDKLVARDLVVRGRDDQDRRVVTIRLTADGLALAEDAELNRTLQATHRRHFAHLGRAQTLQLTALLERLRER